jgi:hypothetical protein
VLLGLRGRTGGGAAESWFGWIGPAGLVSSMHENGSGYHICFYVFGRIRIRIQIVSTMSDKIQLDIDIINIRFKFSDTDTVSDIEHLNLDADRSGPL